MKCNNKFWVENFKDLFCCFNLAPLPSMTLEEQMNALTRTVFIIFIILLLLDYRYDFIFLILSLIFIIILYYVQRKNMQENFTDFSNIPAKAKVFTDPNASAISYSLKYTSTPIQSLPSNSRWRDQDLNLSKNFNDPSYISENQKLAGGPIPRTKVPPIIVPPIADTEYWRPNDFVIPSGINDQKTQELIQSGYAGCNNKFNCVKFEKSCSTSPVSYIYNDNTHGCYKNEQMPDPFEGKYIDMQQCKKNCNLKENYSNTIARKVDNNCTDCCDYTENNPCVSQTYTLHNKKPGEMITPMGYNSHQLELHNIPSNLAVGNCQKDNKFNCYNKNLFTSIIQPGVYARSEIIEPIDSNMGISFTQQFEPITCETDCEGGTTFISHDPRLVQNNPITEYTFKETANESNIYDPRFTGYGTGYRTYIEPVTGQPRFYYDDVDAIKKYNYITRNKLDFTKYGNSAGPMTHKEFSNTENIRKKAAMTFLNDTINRRTELQERLMRKINANAWQQKVAPIHTRSMV